jgi:mRNA interferase MazF
VPFNQRAGLALVCPITSRAKGYPFEVALRGNGDVAGVVLVDQLRSLDWRLCQPDRRGDPGWSLLKLRDL